MEKKTGQNLAGRGKPQIITRPPVVVLLGHVDHGKTTLLDAIAGSKFTRLEFGEITQSIRAIEVETKFGKITFIDTPGHSYFANLRGKGVGFADIALLVVSAVEGVKAQTVESIKLVKTAKIPLLCVITKIDLPQANTATVKKQLASFEIFPEGEGGTTPLVEVSSVKKTGVKDLVETIAIMASLEDYKADLNFDASGVILESFLDKGAGPTSLVLVKNGVLNQGSQIKAEEVLGKVRAIFDQDGKLVEKALPSQPVKILGFDKVILAGSEFSVAGNLAAKFPEPEFSTKRVTISHRELVKKQLGIILKADSVGSVEAVLSNLPKDVTVVDSGIGQVTTSDVEKARALQAKIFGFNVAATKDAVKLLEDHESVLFTSKLIYEVIDKIEEAITAFIQRKEQVLGTARILKSFNIDGVKIAGCKVLAGFLQVGGNVKIMRGETEIAKSQIVSIKQFAKTVNKVTAGAECGIGLAMPVDFEVGDDLKFIS